MGGKCQKNRTNNVEIENKMPHCVLEQFTFSIHCEIDSSRPIMFVVKGIFLEPAQWVKTFLKWHSHLTNYLISPDIYENACNIYILKGISQGGIMLRF